MMVLLLMVVAGVGMGVGWVPGGPAITSPQPLVGPVVGGSLPLLPALLGGVLALPVPVGGSRGWHHCHGGDDDRGGWWWCGCEEGTGHGGCLQGLAR
jgi:hypothetical protein